MIELYYWTTPNGHKITMFLEEVELPYTIVPINIGALPIHPLTAANQFQCLNLVQFCCI